MSLAEVSLTKTKASKTEPSSPFQRMAGRVTELLASLAESKTIDRPADHERLAELMEMAKPFGSYKVGASQELHDLFREIRSESQATIEVRRPGGEAARGIPAASSAEHREYLRELLERALADIQAADASQIEGGKPTEDARAGG
jgi:hypothetical protein